MDGRRALIYARIRINQLDPSETTSRAASGSRRSSRPIADEITSFDTFLRMPFIGDEPVAPLATDLSANQFVQLGWVKQRDALRRPPPLPSRRLGRRHRRPVVHHRERGQCLDHRHGRRQGSPRSGRGPGEGLFGPGCRVGRSDWAQLSARAGMPDQPWTRRPSIRWASTRACSSRPIRRPAVVATVAVLRRGAPVLRALVGRSRSPSPSKWIAAGYSTFVSRPFSRRSPTPRADGSHACVETAPNVCPLGTADIRRSAS